MSVKIICDSACDMSLEEAEKTGVKLVPLKTLIDGKEYRDGLDIKGPEFYRLLKSCKSGPGTSQVSPQEFLDVLEEAGREQEIVLITMCGKLSGTAQSAAIAAAEFGGRVYHVDSLNVSAGEQVLLRYAVSLRDRGMDGKAIAEELERVKNKICLIGRLDTLEYLKRGGRISKTTAFAGTMLNIKPVLELTGGEIKILGKARGEKQSNNMLNEFIDKKGGIDYSMPIMLAYSGLDRTLLDAYKENSRKLWEGKVETLSDCIVGSTIGTHAGPGAVLVAIFKK